jgi:hypothetical protein
MQEYTLNFTQANIYALALYIPVTAAFVLPYAMIYGWSALGTDILLFFTDIPIFVISIILGTVAHELIHAICWKWLDGIPWEKIHFGFKWKVLTPYVHCPDPVEVTNYRWGVAMPGIVLGVIPYLLSLILQNGWLLGFGLFFTLAAGGDILILWLLRDVRSGKKVQDHPEEVGCIVMDDGLNL